MATRQKTKRQHHSRTQRRNPRTSQFRAEQPDEQLYKMVAAVAQDVRPDGPERLTVHQFNDNRERVAHLLDEPVPPKANAIYLRLNHRRPKGKRSSWKQIVAHALRGNHVRRVTTDTRSEPAWFQDEGYLVYSLRRIADHLGIKLGEPGCPPDTYDRAYRELIAADRQLKRGQLLSDLLLTSGQIKGAADKHGWGGAWELAGYLPPEKSVLHGFDTLRVLAHYYETKPGLPRNYGELQKHAARMDIPLPAWSKDDRWSDVRARFIRERAERGLETPREGPLPEQALTNAEVAALLEGAPKMRRKGYWLVLENVVEALADYVDEYEGREPLRQKHYLSVYASYGWPAASRITACAKENGIGAGHGESHWRSMLELASKRARQRRRRAA
jgi:hypothetical protein